MYASSHFQNRAKCYFPGRRRATALLLCLFVISLVTIIVVSVVDTQMLQMTALRHTQEYERALHLASAAIHHAMALLEEDSYRSVPFTIGPVEYPVGSGNTYRADVVASGDDLLITGSGTSGNFTRYVRATATQ